MAAGPGKRSDFVIYEPQFQSGMWEGLTQFVQGFNAPSRNALRMVTQSQAGQLVKEAFYKDIGTSLITRKDHTSVAALTPQKLERAEHISVKLDRKFMVENTVDSFIKSGLSSGDMGEFSFAVGQQVGAHKAQLAFNDAVAAVRAVIAKGTTTTIYTAPTGTGLKHQHLARGLRLAGDQASQIVSWVMHSHSHTDLMIGALADAVAAYDSLNGVIVNQGSVPTLNRPAVVSDVAALTDDNDSAETTYDILGLFQNALTVNFSEDDVVVAEIVTGKEQLMFRVQGEFAYTLGIRGFKWAGAGGDAVNPSASALTTGSNWTAVVTDPVKNGPGIMIVTEGAPA